MVISLYVRKFSLTKNQTTERENWETAFLCILGRSKKMDIFWSGATYCHWLTDM